MNPSPNLFVIGPTGAGKSALGAWLAPRLGLALVDVDRIIEAQAGMPVATIFAREGEAGFRTREAAVLDEYCTHAGMLLVGGGGIVTRPDNRARLARHGFVLWLDVDAALRAQRLQGDAAVRPLLAGADLLQRLRQLDAEREPLYADCADLALTLASEVAIDVLGQRAQSQLAARWQRHASAESSP